MKSSPVVVALLALCLAACGSEVKQPEPVVRPVLSTVIKPLDARSLEFVGTVEPRVRNVLAFQIFGRLVSRNADIGDVVKQGQRLAAIDTVALEQSIRTSEASLAGARAELINATNNEERKRALLRTGAATQAEVDAAVQALEASKSAVTRGQSDLAKSRDQLGYAQMSASFDGVVTAISAEVGQVVPAGSPVMTIARPDLRDAVVDLPETASELVQIGTAFSVALELNPAIKVRGKIREIAPTAEATTRTRRVKIALDDPPDGFRLGSTITASPEVRSEARIILPASAIMTRQGQTFLWIVDASAKTVSTLEVKVTPFAADQVQVLSALETGTRVVTAGVNSLKEGQRVKIAGVQ